MDIAYAQTRDRQDRQTGRQTNRQTEVNSETQKLIHVARVG